MSENKLEGLLDEAEDRARFLAPAGNDGVEAFFRSQFRVRLRKTSCLAGFAWGLMLTRLIKEGRQ